MPRTWPSTPARPNPACGVERVPAAVLDPALAPAWILSAWASGAALIVPVEGLLRPRAGCRQRPLPAWAIQLGIWTLAFGLLLLVSRRPVFSAALALAGALLVVLVNNAKYQALREPFLFSDFGLFSQALRHPRLYLPFLGLGRALLGITAFALSLYLGLTLEPSLAARIGAGPFLAVVAAATLLGALGLWWGDRSAPRPTLDPAHDVGALGLAASLWLYWRLESGPPPPAAVTLSPPSPPARPGPRARALPHILAVQSESFFDARRLPLAIAPDVLAHFDRAGREAVLRGRLRVPAWGANTMRTEFGFLTGIPADALGVHRFNPYRRFARRALPSLASQLRALGYRTLCIHPHPASFFARDRVYPLLGFDEFIDIRRFDRTRTCGPYICDAAVGGMVAEIMQDAKRPLFVFAITMENHGPLHLEQVSDADTARLYRTPPPPGSEDLSVYLRHLANADRMLADMQTLLRQQARPGVLCWFGDHVPSMPRVYAAHDFSDGRTDYLVWRSDHRGGARGVRDIAVEALGPALLDAAGLTGPA